MDLFLTPEFRKTILGVYRERGEVWLRNLPNLLEKFAEKWDVILGKPFPLSFNFVISATTASGLPVVLKAGVPDRENSMQIDALRIYDGHGIVRLLDFDVDECIMLLEYVQPGTTLRSELDESNDDQATEIAGAMMRKLWRPLKCNHNIRTLESWTEGILQIRPHFGGGTGPMPQKLVDRAICLHPDLLVSAGSPYLLHGDLHHENILRANREQWLAIDPKGVAGDRAFDVCSLLMNPLPDFLNWSNPKERVRRRIEILSDILEIDADRLKEWGVVYSVLSAWWSIGEGMDGWEPTITIGELIGDN